MGWPQCNQTTEYERVDEHPLWHGVTIHRLGLFLSAIFGLIAVIVSVYLMFMHATHYLKPHEQRHIIRVLFMVPIYSMVSFLSYLYYRHAVYFEVLRDCYEAFAIASFFNLLCAYLAPDLHSQKDYFRSVRPRDWVLPVSWFSQWKCCGGKNGLWRTPRSGLTWFNVIWVGIFQYCFVRVFMTGIAVFTQLGGVYCQESWNPAFSHFWVTGIECICVTIAMYCIVQFYLQVKSDIAEHRPFLKVAMIKLVIFLSFWQTTLISLLTGTGLVKSSKTVGTPDLKIGIPAMLLCIEMAIFAVMHLWAFSWRPYRISSAIVASESVPGYGPTKASYKGGFLGWKAIFEAFNPWDLVKAIARSGRWLLVGRKQRLNDPSYQTSTSAVGLHSTNTAGSDGGFPPPGATAYGGGKLGPGGKPGRYAGSDIGEGEELLSHAQSNPMSYPAPPAYTTTGDIGMATSHYGDEDRSWDSRDASFDGRQDQLPHHPQPNQGRGVPPVTVTDTDDGYGNRGQQTGIIGLASSTPYPEEDETRRGMPPTEMPYFAPPPSDEKRDRSMRRSR